jgi:hypothetical protein
MSIIFKKSYYSDERYRISICIGTSKKLSITIKKNEQKCRWHHNRVAYFWVEKDEPIYYVYSRLIKQNVKGITIREIIEDVIDRRS